MTVFGENLKQIRLERNLSQDELAILLGTSKQVISRYETGQRSPKVSVVAEYAEKLGVTINRLATGRQNEIEKDSDPWTLRQEEREDPDRKALFLLSKYGSAKDIRQVNALIDALKATNPDFYDGDDPA